MDVIGTIASCLDLAYWVAEQVKKYVEAPQNLRAICDDALLIQTYLGQLQDSVKPDPKAALTARKLPDGNVRSALDVVHSCQAVLGKIEVLVRIVLQERVGIEGTFVATAGIRLRYRYHETEFDKLRADLKDVELHLVLASSLQTLFLSRQPAQMHPLDRREIDNLTMMVGLVWSAIKETKESRAPDTSIQPGSDSFVSTWAHPDQTGGKDIMLSHNDGTVVRRGNVARVERSWLSQAVLMRKECRWLHDPFDQTMITIYDVTEAELQALLRESQVELKRVVADNSSQSISEAQEHNTAMVGKKYHTADTVVVAAATVASSETPDSHRRFPWPFRRKNRTPEPEIEVVQPVSQYSAPQLRVSSTNNATIQHAPLRTQTDVNHTAATTFADEVEDPTLSEEPEASIIAENEARIASGQDSTHTHHAPSSDTSPAYLSSNQTLVDFLLQDTSPNTPMEQM